MVKRKNKKKHRTIKISSTTEAKLNVIIALLLIMVGDEGVKKLPKKRRANVDIVRYLSKCDLSNKDLADILNTSESSIRHLKVKKK